MSTVSTHVLDTSLGRPGRGIVVVLERLGDQPEEVASGVTDVDGRISYIGPQGLEEGNYRLTFATGAYFAATGTETLFPEVQLVFTIAEPDEHYHVPVLLSPFAYSTYRGS